jgi:biopolymer transport protein ExbB
MNKTLVMDMNEIMIASSRTSLRALAKLRAAYCLGGALPLHFAAFICIALLGCIFSESAAAQGAPNGIGGFSGAPAPIMSDQPSARLAAAPNLGATSQPTDPASLGGDSNSNVEEASIQMGNIISIVREGGVLMLPIIACSMVLLVFVFERSLFLRRGRIIPRPFVRGVIEQLEQQQLDRDEAIALCEENGSPIAELFIAAMKKWGRSAVEVEQAVLDAGERVTSQLRKYLRLFSAISNLTPLLGLLGTVLGMIDAFNTIAKADAMGRPELLAGGIGAALVTTAAGLCVAIPAYAAYAFFLGRTDKLILEMDALAQNVVEQISAEALQSGTGRSRNRSRKAA